MLDAIQVEHVYIACGYTDLRRGIDRLVSLVQSSFHLGIFSGSLFLFCERRVDWIKALYWDTDGFVLLYKRLERGQYQWPHTTEDVKELMPQQRRWLQEGSSIYQPKAHRPVTNVQEL